MDKEHNDAPNVLMLPPTMFVMHITAGILLNWIVGLFTPVGLSHGWGWLGLLFVTGGFTLVSWSKKLFSRAGTNVPPNQPATVIVTDGPYQYTRNPMYLSMLLGFAGLAFLAGTPVMLLMIFPLFYLLDQKVIAPEEEYLADKFGNDYLDYKHQVRRWI